MNRAITIILGILTAAFTLTACEEDYRIESEQAKPQLVIEGLLTNENKRHEVKLSLSQDYYIKGSTAKISKATVKVTDEEGTEIEYFEDNDTLGLYRPLAPFLGVVGQSYRLDVYLGETHYEAIETLFRVSDLDSLVSKPAEDGDGFEVLMYTHDPQDTRDFYLFKYYKNGVRGNPYGWTVLYADDEVIGENIDGWPLEERFELGDLCRLEMYSLSPQQFVFYNDLSITLDNDGGLFGSVPTNPRTNLSNGALGLWQVSAVSVKELVVK